MLMPRKQRHEQYVAFFPIEPPAIDDGITFAFQDEHRRFTNLAVHRPGSARTELRQTPGDNMAAEVIPAGAAAFDALDGFELDLAHFDCVLIFIEIFPQTILQTARTIERTSVWAHLNHWPHIRFL